MPICSDSYQDRAGQRMALLKSWMPDLAPFPAALDCDFVIEEPGNCFWEPRVTWSRSSQGEVAESAWATLCPPLPRLCSSQPC